MSEHTYYNGWRRILARAGLPPIGTHGIRHRAATDIANSGIPVKVGMALTAHKTVTMFMRYVHAEDDRIRAAAETVTQRRQALVAGTVIGETPSTELAAMPQPRIAPVSKVAPITNPEPPGVKDGKRVSRTKLSNYQPFRYRHG